MDGRYTMAWVQANLTRAAKMPKLEDLIAKDKKPVVKFDEEKSKALFRAHNALVMKAKAKKAN